MKKLSIKSIGLIAAMGLIGDGAMAQKVDMNVPPAVINVYGTQYPTAKLKKWEVKNDTCIAIFTMNKRNYKASYAMNGKWYSSERNMKHMANLPADARTYLKTNNYLSWNVDRMEKIETPVRTTYVLQLDNHSGNQNQYEGTAAAMDKMLYFNQNGQLVRVKQL